MDMHVAIRAFLAHKRLEGLTAETLEHYACDLLRWYSWQQEGGAGTDLHDITFPGTRKFFAYLANEARSKRGARRNMAGLSPARVWSYRRSCSVFWKWLMLEIDEVGLPLIRPEQHHFFNRGRIPLPGLPKSVRPEITRAQFDALLAVAGDGNDEESARDLALLWMLWDTGARVFEIARLRDANIDLLEREAYVLGKGTEGGKPGMICWTPNTNYALRRYLKLRRGASYEMPQVRQYSPSWNNEDSPPLFRGNSSRNNGDAVTPNLIRCMIKRLAKRACILLPLGSPCHAFRHAFARRMRRAGRTKEEVGILLRDSTPAVIDRYLGLDEEPHRQLYRQANGLDKERAEKTGN
jgi:integrase/recombinase XerD